jgi:glycosyltransferase involved in cell wall biosynthesis
MVCDWFLKYAGREAIGLSNAGAEVGLMCRSHAFEFGNSQDERSSLLAHAKENGVSIFEVDGRITSVRTLPSVGRTWRSARQWRPDVVHAQENYDPRLFALTRGYPSIFEIHDPRPDPRQRPEIAGIASVIRRAWTSRASRVVVHGEQLRDELDGRVARERIVVVPHGLEPSHAPVSPPARPTVLLFGRLEPYKGIDVLLRAMRIVWAERPEVILRIAGKGSAAGQIPRDPRIDAMLGYVPEERVNALLDGASLLVLPYLVGSQSGAGSLAIGRGIPCIVTEVGSLRDLALDDSFIVPPGNAAALASAVLRHLDHDSRLRAAVLERARRKFSWEAVARRNVKIYETVLDGHVS